MLFDTQ